MSPDDGTSYSGKPVFLQIAFSRGSPLRMAYSGAISSLPTRVGPMGTICSKISKIRSLSASATKIRALLAGRGTAARLVKKLGPIENAGHRQNGPNWVGTTLSASFQADVTSCYVKFRQTFLGPSAHPATIIEFKQIEFFTLRAPSRRWMRQAGRRSGTSTRVRNGGSLR